MIWLLHKSAQVSINIVFSALWIGLIAERTVRIEAASDPHQTEQDLQRGPLSLFLRIFPGLDHSQNDDNDDDQNGDQRATHELPRLLLQLLSLDQLRHPLLYVVAGLCHLSTHITRTLPQNSRATYDTVTLSQNSPEQQPARKLHALHDFHRSTPVQSLTLCCTHAGSRHWQAPRVTNCLLAGRQAMRTVTAGCLTCLARYSLKPET